MFIMKNAHEDELFEYTVARYVDGEWWLWGSWEERDNAYAAAADVGGRVFHRDEFEPEWRM